MPRTVIKNDITTVTYWEYQEWCQELPKWWVEECGCRRCCDGMPELPPEIARELALEGWTVWRGWALKQEDNGTCIYPWPKKMHRGWPWLEARDREDA